ncbi:MULTISPECIES: ABC transporter ATP-binding protein [Prochlorococcus]|uniref:Putative ABC transporter n=1 Tax=Prochlorococcus marinus str. MIT 9116 TaxID=167544 RepID=A0A0A1ZPG4_PROMR|nr:ABC transporter ATP-binding protein [Prochlorococcus marinus]KGF89287.1 putative ABC transporter [Prochlorococcus marinus str. MIT 9107]KGF90043.1 putative ABC transporter [Prochlorococcus marinus str. MIT 9116]
MINSFENQIPHIYFKDVSFSYHEKKENLIFKCNLSIKKTGFWMIVGKNGSGKSTLLKLINGIIKPKNGIVNCKANIGMVFQNPDHQILMPNCRSELLLNINQNISDYQIRKKIEYVLDLVGLNGFEKRPVHTLSGGQKQRLTIACALISNKNFILLDEPTALLDPTSQLKVLKTIKNLTSDYKKPLSALWITHRYEELTYADAVAELKNGVLSGWQEPSKFQYN